MSTVFYEATPNPQALRFIVTTGPIADRTQDFQAGGNHSLSPLAAKLFGFPWCAGVLVSPTSVTVTKEDWVDWETLADPLAQIIGEHVDNGEKVLLAPPNTAESAGKAAQAVTSDDPVVQKITAILENEIRPAVAMDGGDIIFESYKDGVVYLHMVGACSGCPSSTFTLKEGIESRIRQMVPEVQEVVAL